MRYRITGADKETGVDVDLTIETADVAGAELLAQRKHILISSIKPEAVSTPAKPAKSVFNDRDWASVQTSLRPSPQPLPARVPTPSPIRPSHAPIPPLQPPSKARAVQKHVASSVPPSVSSDGEILIDDGTIPLSAPALPVASPSLPLSSTAHGLPMRQQAAKFEKRELKGSPARRTGGKLRAVLIVFGACFLGVLFCVVYYSRNVTPAMQGAHESADERTWGKKDNQQAQLSEYQKYQDNKGALPQIEVIGSAADALTFRDWKTVYNSLSGVVTWNGLATIHTVTYTVKRDKVVVYRGSIEMDGWKRDEPERIQVNLMDFPKGLTVTINVDGEH